MQISYTMRSPLLWALIVLNIQLAQAQTLVKSDIQPQIGEHYMERRSASPENTNPGGPGTSQVWDLSNLSYNPDVKFWYYVISPAVAPHQEPDADYVVKEFPVSDTSMVGHSYYADTTSGFFLIHEYGSIIEINYGTPEFIYQFPLAFGDSATSPYQFTTEAFGTVYTYEGSSSMKFDGAGTLKLPGGIQVDAVYRLKYSGKTIRTSHGDTSYLTEYNWFKPGIHHPVVQYTEYKDANGLIYKTTKFYDLSNNAALRKTALTSTMPFPNPCNDKLYFSQFNGPEYLLLTDVSGKEIAVKRSRENDLCTYDMRDVTNGIYSLRLFINDHLTHHKIEVIH